MSDMYVGEIRAFAGNFQIANWAFCDGRLIAISQNPTLFQIIGTTYGGDGVNTFGLPNMRANLAVGTGQGIGLQNWVLGEIQGSTSITLTSQMVPQHTHQATFADNVQFNYELPTATNVTYPGRLGTTADVGNDAYSAMSPHATPMHSATVSTFGSSLPHTNTMPTQVIPFIISLFGIFPSQN